MRKLPLILLLLPAIVLIGREAGWFRLEAARSSKLMFTSYSVDTLPPFHVGKLRLMREPDGPFCPEPENATNPGLVVTYRVSDSLSPWRWVPLYKWGANAAQITFLVWMQGHLQGCGTIYSTGHQTVLGLSSARAYRENIVHPLYEEMVKKLKNKYGPVTEVPPGSIKTQPPLPIPR